MKSMKKVEIVFEAVYVNKLLDLFKKHGITGYTLIKDVQGCGGHGLKTADDVTDVFTNDYIFTVIEEEKYKSFDYDIRRFLDRYGGKCMLSDVMLLLGKKQKAESINLQYSGKTSEDI